MPVAEQNAFVGAQVGFSGIPKRFIEGLDYSIALPELDCR
jgi:hypothetical protein